MANTLLVLGNGFDLKCGLRTQFKDYLDSIKESNRGLACVNAMNRALEISKRTIHFVGETSELNVFFDDLLFWDLFFSVEYYHDSEKEEKFGDWFNFEARLRNFVIAAMNGSGSFKEIESANFSGMPSLTDSVEQLRVLLLSLYLRYKSKAFVDGKLNKVYLAEFLLDELKEYEKAFGLYIEDQQKSSAHYANNANLFVKELVGKNETEAHKLTYLNTFNYSDLSGVVPSDCSIWHINGDSSCPIFGIDLPLQDSEDVRTQNMNNLENRTAQAWYRFTKTYRRLELEGRRELFPAKQQKFTRIVVYGHSLNKQDYNFFYALFNHLGFSLTRTTNNYVVEFMYSAYGKVTKEEAKRLLIDRALPLLQGYTREVLHEPNFRLMDILYSNGAIRFVEAPLVTMLW